MPRMFAGSNVTSPQPSWSRRAVTVRLEFPLVHAQLPPWHQMSPDLTANSPVLPVSPASRSNLSTDIPVRSRGASRFSPYQLPSCAATTSRPAAPSVWKAIDCATLSPSPGLNGAQPSTPDSNEYSTRSVGFGTSAGVCLLYTSDAADDLLCVDLGGRRIIK